MENSDRAGNDRAHDDSSATSGAPPGLESVSQASGSAAPTVEGNPNPFWSERYEEEYRLCAADLVSSMERSDK